jgi:GNAT superfamily N-acetyltransferase
VVDEKNTPIAAAIAIQQPISRERSGDNASLRSSAATIVHSAPLREIDDSRRQSVADALASRLDQVLRKREVQFIQWATEPNGADIEKWCAALGFEPIAELEYLSGSIEPAETSAAKAIAEGTLLLNPLDWNASPESLSRFIALVERTYINTGDCPRLTSFRTARQTLDGYQDSTAFAPELWYRVVAPGNDRETDDGETEIGCLILSKHDSEKVPVGVVELVYMGLVPESRGKRLGPQVMAMAIDQGRHAGADQMIMAVDRSNTAARRIYHQSGFIPILAESVWAKSI